MEVKKDNQLLRLVRVFTVFKTHVSIFIVVMALLWLIWLFGDRTKILPWPVYPSFIWSVILLVHYMVASGAFRKVSK